MFKSCATLIMMTIVFFSWTGWNSFHMSKDEISTKTYLTISKYTNYKHIYTFTQVYTHTHPPPSYTHYYMELMTWHELKCCWYINRKNANRGNSIINNILIDSLINLTCLSKMFSLTVYFIADTILHFQPCSVSRTLSLSLSLCCIALSPASTVWHRNPGIHFHLIINRIRLTLLFHLEVAHNNTLFFNIVQKYFFPNVIFIYFLALETFASIYLVGDF